MTEHERLALAEEAHDLGIHVRMCALRHQQIIQKVEGLNEAARERLDTTDARLGRIEKAAYLILATLGGGGAFTAAQILPILRGLGGH